MARSYYSTVFDQSASRVWDAIRDFGGYRVWIPDADASIEDGRAGDAVGAVRDVRIGDLRIRQQLVAHSDVERSYSYTALEPLRFPEVHNFLATLRVTPVVDGDRAFVEWWVSFDCSTDELDRWTKQFADMFAGWLESLRNVLSAPPN
jgi:Polyketide cyclase / dehydrase and lipid transport